MVISRGKAIGEWQAQLSVEFVAIINEWINIDRRVEMASNDDDFTQGRVPEPEPDVMLLNQSSVNQKPPPSGPTKGNHGH